MLIYLQLFLTFLKIGAVSFGGGYAMIPLIQDEVISNGWLNSEQILNFIAVSESTPGPIAINMSTFVGSSQAGILGAICATLGVIMPSFVIILIVASVIKGLLKFAGVKAFIDGLRPVVVGLILGTAITIIMQVVFAFENIQISTISIDYKAVIIFAIVAGISIFTKKKTKKAISPILLIIISAVLGLILYGLL
ncbi:MAG: chromate transporter [Clostridiales bacterium]|nr:chromate transporter [Clostridiales bacterium]